MEETEENEADSLLTAKNLFLGLMVFAAVTALAVGGASLYKNYTHVAQGVTSGGVELGGMTGAEVRRFFEKNAADKMAQYSLVLTYGDKKWQITPQSIELTPQTEQAAQAAFDVGHDQKLAANLKKQYLTAKHGHEIALTAEYNQKALTDILTWIAQEVYVPPVSAYATLAADGTILKYAEVLGKRLDVEALADELAPKLINLEIPYQSEIALVDEAPWVRTADIAPLNDIIGSYSTNFFRGDRGDNISLAASHLNGVLVRKGETCSFNSLVGYRTGSAGYKNAGVIIDGRLEDGIGGGVCQVSSTLYNAILLAGLTPTMRTPHYAPSTYCPPGRDATVADDLLDLQFKNNLAHNVYIVAGTYGTSLNIFVLGAREDLNGNTIYLETEGSAMRPTLYRVYAKNGQVVEREYLHTDYYEPVRQ